MTEIEMTHSTCDEADLLHGAAAVADFLGVNPRRAFYLLESGELPAFKLGGRWALRKSKCRAAIEARENAHT